MFVKKKLFYLLNKVKVETVTFFRIFKDCKTLLGLQICCARFWSSLQIFLCLF